MSWEHEFAKKCILFSLISLKNYLLKKESKSLSFHFKLLSLNDGNVNLNTSKRAQIFIYYLILKIYFPKFDFSISLPDPDVYAVEASMPRINMGLNTNSLEQDVFKRKKCYPSANWFYMTTCWEIVSAMKNILILKKQKATFFGCKKYSNIIAEITSFIL